MRRIVTFAFGAALIAVAAVGCSSARGGNYGAEVSASAPTEAANPAAAANNVNALSGDAGQLPTSY